MSYKIWKSLNKFLGIKNLEKGKERVSVLDCLLKMICE